MKRSILKEKFNCAIAVILAALLVCFVPLCVQPGDAYAVTAAEKKAEANAALAQLEALSSELDAVSDVYFGALAQAQDAQNRIDEAQARIDAATAEIANRKERIETRATAMYKNGAASMLDLLLGAATFEEFATTWDLLNQINDSDAELIKENKALKQELAEQQVELEAAKAEAEAQAASVQEAYEKAAKLEQAQREVYNSLNSEAQSLMRAEQAAAVAQAMQSAVYDYDKSNTILNRAFSKLDAGVWYSWGAAGPDCFDCSGFVSWCYGYSGHMFTSYTLYKLPEVDDPQPGDVCVEWDHAAIYIGEGMLIECTSACNGVRIYPMRSSYKIVRPSSNW